MRRILLTLISVVALAALVACGDSHNNSSSSIPSNPAGGNNAGFSNSNLNGTYVFTTDGLNGKNASFVTLGVFTADGNGNITAGSRDTYTDAGNRTQKETVTGTYAVNADGRGQVILNGRSSGKAVYRFVMQSPSSASFFQFSPDTDDTGRMQLQTTVTAGGAGTFIIRLDGEDTSRNVYGAIGALTVSGTAVTGTIDQNDNGTLLAQLSATGTMSAPDSTGRGTLSFTTSSGTHNFVYYWVTPSHIELASTDTNFFLHGYADLQTSVAGTAAAFTGDQIFSLSGYGSSGPLIEAGRFTLDGAGNLASGIEDFNLNGIYTGAAALTGSYAVAANGRWTAIENGASSNLIGWQVSPQQSVVLSWNSASNVLETGVMRAQTSGITTANVTGEYALNLSGYNLLDAGYVESTANYLADGNGNLTGTLDSQTPGFYNTDVAETGTYAILANGRSPASIGGVPVIIYTVDASTMYLISSDSNRFYTGRLSQQLP